MTRRKMSGLCFGICTHYTTTAGVNEQISEEWSFVACFTTKLSNTIYYILFCQVFSLILCLFRKDYLKVWMSPSYLPLNNNQSNNLLLVFRFKYLYTLLVFLKHDWLISIYNAIQYQNRKKIYEFLILSFLH